MNQLVPKSIGITLRVGNTQLLERFRLIKNAFLKYQVEVFLDDRCVQTLRDAQGFMAEDLEMVKILELEQMCAQVDILVCCGGDGTLLNLVRNSFVHQKPIMTVQGGNLSFLLQLKSHEIADFVDCIFVGNYLTKKHMMLEVSPQGGGQSLHCFNDVVFKNKDPMKMVKLELFIDEQWINTYYGDGLIVSTPSGSTGYNLASSGPIMESSMEAMIVTPISAHGLTQAPLVLPCCHTLSVKSLSDDNIFAIDGKVYADFDFHKPMYIKKSCYGVNLLSGLDDSLLKNLKEKLSWGV